MDVSVGYLLGVTVGYHTEGSLFSKLLSKTSITHRVSSAEENKAILSNIGENLDFINKCDTKKKAIFVSWCFEYSRLVEWENSDKASSFHTRYAVQLDASCSGLQHLVMLIKNMEHMPHLNLTKMEVSDKPRDFYSFTAETINIMMASYIKANKDSTDPKKLATCARYERLITFGLTISQIKTALMTYNYNAGRKVMCKYIEESLATTCETSKYLKVGDNPMELLENNNYKCAKGEQVITKYVFEGN